MSGEIRKSIINNAKQAKLYNINTNKDVLNPIDISNSISPTDNNCIKPFVIFKSSPTLYLGTFIRERISVNTSSGLIPSNSNSGFKVIRCLRVGIAIFLISSGVMKSLPL